jgi:hypothetical protein
VRTVIKHVTKLLQERWPNTRIVWRGDGHYGRVEAMEWIEANGDSDYIFGLSGNPVLDKQVAEVADNLRIHHAKSSQAKLRTERARPIDTGMTTPGNKTKFRSGTMTSASDGSGNGPAALSTLAGLSEEVSP